MATQVSFCMYGCIFSTCYISYIFFLSMPVAFLWRTEICGGYKNALLSKSGPKIQSYHWDSNPGPLNPGLGHGASQYHGEAQYIYCCLQQNIYLEVKSVKSNV